MTTGARTPTLGSVVADLDRRYPHAWAEQWDRVGLVVGEPEAPIRRILCVVDCVPETVAEALAVRADLIVAHHPLLLRGVSSVAATTYKGRIVHDLIKAGVALYAAHTNADVANPGVADALAARFGLLDTRPLRPAAPNGPAASSDRPAASSDRPAAGGGRGAGRIGRLPAPMTLAELTGYVAAVLPPTAWGVRAAGDPDRRIVTMAVSGGSGDGFLGDAVAAGVDAFLAADLRHHPASEHISGGGPALIDAAHWATERPWCDEVAGYLRERFGTDTIVSDLDTDPWTLHAASPGYPPSASPRPAPSSPAPDGSTSSALDEVAALPKEPRP